MRVPPLAPSLLAAAIAAGVAAWLLLGDPAGSAGTGADSAHALAGDDGSSVAPGLQTVGRAPPSPTRPPTDAAPPASGTEAPAAREEVTILDAGGHALRGATLLLDVQGPRGSGTVKALTDADGKARIAWPVGRVVRVRLQIRGATDTHEIVLLRNPAGLGPTALGTLAADALAWLSVRTVDTRGDVRPRQRVLFRPRIADLEPTGRWGQTSGEDGVCLLGPFRVGSTVEVRAGPRGVPADALAAEGSWTPCRVDGTPVDVVVGDRPRLRLVFPELLGGTSVRIAVLDASTGRPVFPPTTHVAGTGTWTSPALAEDLVPEVFAGPLADGRWARVTGMRVGEEPIEVRLEQGHFLRGRVVGPEAHGTLKGQVRAYGRGFEVEAWVAPDGGFTLGGMPDESVTLVARSIRAAEGKRPLGGILRRATEEDVALAVAPLVTITGFVLGADGTPPRSVAVQATRDDLPPDAQPSHLAYGGRFRLQLPPGAWHLIAPAGSQRPWADLDLGDVQADREGVELRMRAP